MALEKCTRPDGTSWALNHADGNMARIDAAFDEVDVNTTHSAGTGADHSGVALNTTHRTGDGTDHAAVASLQDEVDTGVIGQARLILATVPTPADTITIGADIYEADGAGANINFVVVGGDAAATLANLITAINTLGTEAVFASVDSVVATTLVIENADAAGGTPEVGTANIALSAALSAGGNIWDQTNLNFTGSVRFSDRAEGTLVVDAVNVATPLKIELAFVPTQLEWALFTTAGVPKPTSATGVITAGQLLFTLSAGGAPAVATDILTWRARG